jgi:hypothetical protein
MRISDLISLASSIGDKYIDNGKLKKDGYVIRFSKAEWTKNNEAEKQGTRHKGSRLTRFLPFFLEHLLQIHIGIFYLGF